MGASTGTRRSPRNALLRQGSGSGLPRDVELPLVEGEGDGGSSAAVVGAAGPEVRSPRAGEARAPLSGACYLAYCIVCLTITGALLCATFWQEFAPRWQARFWRRKLRPWEEGCEVFVGSALCTETLVPLRAVGFRHFFRDRWRRLDATIAALTLLCGFFFLLKRVSRRAEDVVQVVDVPMLCLRFALQPVRMVTTAKMVVRAHRLHVAAREAATQTPGLGDPRSPGEARCSPLPPELAAEVRELLPVHLRFAEWKLAYSPRVHGTSMNTFYRRQAGPNVLVIQDAHGGLFGGFANEAWRPQAGAYGTAGEAFVFAVRPGTAAKEAPNANYTEAPAPEGANRQDSDSISAMGQSVHEVELTPTEPAKAHLEVFWAVPQRGRVIQWSDSRMLGLGSAVVVWDDFLRGSSGNCEAFNCSSPLSPDGAEFVVREFECWHIGGNDESL